jgi:hypothetical protein
MAPTAGIVVLGLGATNEVELLMRGTLCHPIVYFEVDGSGPHDHVCGADDPVEEIGRWLQRQKLLGLHPIAVRAIEQLIEDIS